MTTIAPGIQRSTCDFPALLAELYAEQLASCADDPYLAAHAFPRAYRTEAAAFEFYARFIPAVGRVLDWGCRHAPQAVMLRERFGELLRVDGCDFVEPGRYFVFHERAGLEYLQLEENVRLPYADDSFDAVVSSGTLEHVAMDYESLKELYRVLKPGGRLILLYLPNRLSLGEWYRRRILRRDFHRRLYGLGELDQFLKRTGLYPLLAGYQTRLDLLSDRNLKHESLRLLSWVLPLHWFSSTLCAVAEKVHGM